MDCYYREIAIQLDFPVFWYYINYMQNTMIKKDPAQWRSDRIAKIHKYLEREKRKDFIDDEKIEKLIAQKSVLDRKRVADLIEKAKELKGLTPEETAYLMNLQDKDVWEKLFETARYVKNQVYGNRIVLFAPLYLSSNCVNNCLYCGFRTSNPKVQAKNLTDEELVKEVQV